MAMITVVKVLKSTNRADMVLAHFDNPARFTLCWLPKSETKQVMDQYWEIPEWMVENTIRDGEWHDARQYNDERFGIEGVECYAYGTESTGFYTREGEAIDRKDLLT